MGTGRRAALFVLAFAAVPAAAEAQETGPDESHLPKVDAPAEKRSGVVLGLQLGAGAAYTNGYPDDTNQIGDPKYYAASGVMPGTYTTFFIEGALADTVNFGFWFGGASTQNDDWRASGAGGGLRIDAFPLWSVRPWLRDLAAFAELGVGGATLRAKHGDSPGAQGVESYVGLGLFYELRLVRRMLGGHMIWGPFLEGQLATSRPATSRGVFAGVRFAFYGGP